MSDTQERKGEAIHAQSVKRDWHTGKERKGEAIHAKSVKRVWHTGKERRGKTCRECRA